MTTFQDPQPQSRRAVRQGERVDGVEQPVSGEFPAQPPTASATPSYFSDADSQRDMWDTNARRAAQLPATPAPRPESAVTGRRAASSASQPPAAAEPLTYSTASRQPAPTYEPQPFRSRSEARQAEQGTPISQDADASQGASAPQFDSSVAPATDDAASDAPATDDAPTPQDFESPADAQSFRVRDFSPEGRRAAQAAERAAADPVWAPTAPPTDLDYQTEVREGFGAAETPATHPAPISQVPPQYAAAPPPAAAWQPLGAPLSFLAPPMPSAAPAVAEPAFPQPDAVAEPEAVELSDNAEADQADANQPSADQPSADQADANQPSADQPAAESLAESDPGPQDISDAGQWDVPQPAASDTQSTAEASQISTPITAEGQALSRRELRAMLAERQATDNASQDELPASQAEPSALQAEPSAQQDESPALQDEPSASQAELPASQDEPSAQHDESAELPAQRSEPFAWQAEPAVQPAEHFAWQADSVEPPAETSHGETSHREISHDEPVADRREPFDWQGTSTPVAPPAEVAIQAADQAPLYEPAVQSRPDVPQPLIEPALHAPLAYEATRIPEAFARPWLKPEGDWEAPGPFESVSSTEAGAVAEVDALASSDPAAIPSVATDDSSALRPRINHWSIQDEDVDDSIETTVSRRVGSGSNATNALVLPEIPLGSDIRGPLTSTGEVMLTGSIDLPHSLSSTGSSGRMEHEGIDSLFDLTDHEVISTDSQPVRAIKAVSTHQTGHGVTHTRKPKGTRALTVLLIAASAMALVVAGLLVAAFAFNLF